MFQGLPDSALPEELKELRANLGRYDFKTTLKTLEAYAAAQGLSLE